MLAHHLSADIFSETVVVLISDCSTDVYFTCELTDVVHVHIRFLQALKVKLNLLELVVLFRGREVEVFKLAPYCLYLLLAWTSCHGDLLLLAARNRSDRVDVDVVLLKVSISFLGANVFEAGRTEVVSPLWNPDSCHFLTAFNTVDE